MNNKKDKIDETGGKEQYRALGQHFEDVKNGTAKDPEDGFPGLPSLEMAEGLRRMAAYLNARDIK